MTRKALVAIGVLLFAACASDQAAKKHNTDGMDHYRNGRFTDAEAEFAAAARLDPGSALYKHNLGMAYFGQDRCDEAVIQLKESVNRDDKNATRHEHLGDVYLCQGEIDAALAEYRRARALDATQISPHLVDIAFDTATLDGWLKELDETARRARPDDKTGVNLVYRTEQAILHGYTLQGRYDETIARAAADIAAIAGVKTEHGGYVVPIITPFFFVMSSVPKTTWNLKPIIASLYVYRGYAYLCKGMLPEAASDLKVSLETSPKSGGGLALGLANLRAGDSHEAAYQLRKFLETDPTSAIARLYYASALRMEHDTGADAQFDAGRRLAGKFEGRNLKHDYGVLEALAFANEAWERYDVAKALYERVVLACPSCGWSTRSLGAIHVKLGEKDKARPYLERAASLLPSDQRTKDLLHDL